MTDSLYSRLLVMMARWHFTQASLCTTISRYVMIFLGPAAEQLIYRDPVRALDHSNRGRPHCLPPIEEFFLTLVRLRLGLLETKRVSDLA